jgi:hypothetical protein
MFRWINRKQAISQVTHQWRQERDKARELNELHLEADSITRYVFPEDDKNLAIFMDEVLTKFSQPHLARLGIRFCADPDAISIEQWRQFRADIRKEIKRRDDTDAMLADYRAAGCLPAEEVTP